MKQLAIVSIIILIAIHCFSQQTETSVTSRNSEFIQKSKRQTIAGILFAAVGTGMFLGGMSHDLNNLFTDNATSTGFYVLSATLMATGITFFVLAKQNRKRARIATAFFKMEKSQYQQSASIRSVRYPSAGVRFSVR
jgi:hypothetical protein